MTGSQHKKNLGLSGFNELVEVGIGEVDTWARTPVAEKARFNIVRLQRPFKQEIILQENLCNS